MLLLLVALNPVLRALPYWGAVVAILVIEGVILVALAALGAAADKVIFMAYDQHWEGGSPGPIAPTTVPSTLTEARVIWELAHRGRTTARGNLPSNTSASFMRLCMSTQGWE